MIMVTDTARTVTAASTTNPKPAPIRAVRRTPGLFRRPVSSSGSETEPGASPAMPAAASG
jgi:hypothetical protein